MKKLNFKSTLTLLYLTTIAFFIINWGPYDIQIQKLIYLAGPITALATCYLALKQFGTRSPRATSFKILFIALFLWFLGETATLYFSIIKVDTYPSIADVFFLLGYLFFSIAIILKAKFLQINFAQMNRRVLALLTIAFFIISGIVAYFAVQGYSSEESTLVNFVTVSWSLGDLVMGGLSLILLAMIWEFREGAIKNAWYWFIAATTINLIADIIYNLYPESVLDGSILNLILDSMWVSAYFLFAGYFLQRREDFKKIQVKIRQT